MSDGGKDPVEQELATGDDGAPEPEAPPAPPRRAPARIPSWAWVAGLIVASIGLVIGGFRYLEWHERTERQASRCLGLRNTVIDRTGDERFDEAQAALDQAREVCDPSLGAELATLASRLTEKKQDVAARDARNAKRLAEERERTAVATWPEQSKEIDKTLRDGAAALARGDEKGTLAAVTNARDALDEFKGTSIEPSKGWVDLDAREAELRKKILPFIERMIAQLDMQAAVAAAQREDDRRHGVMLTKEGGYPAATNLDKLRKVLQYKAAKDSEGYELLLKNDPEVFPIKPGLRVIPFERIGPAGSYVHARVRGTLVELWTIPEALKEP